MGLRKSFSLGPLQVLSLEETSRDLPKKLDSVDLRATIPAPLSPDIKKGRFLLPISRSFPANLYLLANSLSLAPVPGGIFPASALTVAVGGAVSCSGWGGGWRSVAEMDRNQLGTLGALTLSVVSSVSIVICNKALMSGLDFQFATTLTSWHLLVTFLFLHFARHSEFFEHKPMDPRLLLGFGVLNGISIGFLNLSLGFNSVGFYQMTKLAIIPCTVLLETLFLSKRFSKHVQLSLIVLLIGVGVATVTDLELNFVGTILSLLAIFTTCIAQIMTNTIQKRSKLSSTQLLYQTCPVMAGTLLIAGPFVDRALTGHSVFYFNYTRPVTFFIVLSCLIAISVNFSTFLVIGKTSPVTYQVLGHLKTCLVLFLGFVLFKGHPSFRNVLGIFIALIGMVLYSYVCVQEGQQARARLAEAGLVAGAKSKGAGEGEALLVKGLENGNGGKVALGDSRGAIAV